MTTQQIAALIREDFHLMAEEVWPETRILIDRELVTAKSGDQFETINPTNN